MLTDKDFDTDTWTQTIATILVKALDQTKIIDETRRDQCMITHPRSWSKEEHHPGKFQQKSHRSLS